MDYKSVADFIDEILRRKDPYNHHGANVATICLQMVSLMDVKFNEHELEMLKFGARMHDLGKIFMDDGILNSHGRLTGSQYAAVQTHVTQGFRLALSMSFDPIICSIIRYHHENFEGSGYPDGLKGDAIPFFARMVRVADTYDALTSSRAYRRNSSPADALKVIEAESERCFDPIIVDLLKRILPQHA